MIRSKAAVRIIAASLFVFGIVMLSAPAVAQQQINLVSGTVTGEWFAHMVALGEKVFKPAGFDYSNAPGGGTSNVVAVSTGKADVGFTMPLVITMAAEGQKPFSGKITNVSVIAALYPDPWEGVVPSDTGINSYADLKGKTIVGAPPGQLAEVALGDILKVVGIEGQVTIRKASQSEGTALVKDRHAQFFGWISPKPNPHISELALSRPLKWLELSDAELAKLTKLRAGYIPHTIDAGTYAGQDKEVRTFQTPVVLVVNNDMPEAKAYALTKALIDNIQALRDSGPADLKKITPADLAKIGDTPMHPGAAKLYRELGVLK